VDVRDNKQLWGEQYEKQLPITRQRTSGLRNTWPQ
jgi:hypothetical protein